MGLINIENSQRVKGLIDIKSQTPVKGIYYSDGNGNTNLLYRNVEWKVKKEWTHAFLVPISQVLSFNNNIYTTGTYLNRFSLDGKSESQSNVMIVSSNTTLSVANALGVCNSEPTKNDATFKDFTVRQYDINGNLLWKLSAGIYPRALRTDSQSNVYVMGTDFVDTGSFCLIKISSTGKLLWSIPIGLTKNDFSAFCDFDVDNDGTIFLIFDDNKYSYDTAQVLNAYDQNGVNLSTAKLKRRASYNKIILDKQNHDIFLASQGQFDKMNVEGKTLFTTSFYTLTSPYYAFNRGIYLVSGGEFVLEPVDVYKYNEFGDLLYHVTTDEKFQYQTFTPVPDGFVLGSREPNNSNIVKYTEYEEGAS